MAAEIGARNISAMGWACCPYCGRTSYLPMRIRDYDEREYIATCCLRDFLVYDAECASVVSSTHTDHTDQIVAAALVVSSTRSTHGALVEAALDGRSIEPVGILRSFWRWLW